MFQILREYAALRQSLGQAMECDPNFAAKSWSCKPHVPPPPKPLFFADQWACEDYVRDKFLNSYSRKDFGKALIQACFDHSKLARSGY